MIEKREIVMDTETTGLDPKDGHRVVEIGALELINHVPTGNIFHEYINPRRLMPAEAFAVHGISDGDLADKPAFEEFAQPFMDFIGDATLIIHNAPFDVKFLNFELGRTGLGPILMDRVIDTLQIAREKFPGAQNSLDGLCRRFALDNSKRVKHGALLDSEILADVYLELCGGRQSALILDAEQSREKKLERVDSNYTAKKRPDPRPAALSADDLAKHTAFIADLKGENLWGRE